MSYAKIKPHDLEIYFETYGSFDDGEPGKTLVVCHGGPGMSDHHLYRRFWTDFASKKNLRVILFDMRGHGSSEDGDPTLWTIDQWADDIVALCDALHIEKPIVAGVSFGGWIVQAYATRHPSHPGGLILCNTEAALDPKSQAEAYKQVAAEKGYSDAQIARIEEVVIGVSTAPTDELTEAYRELCMPLQSDTSFTEEELSACRRNTALATAFYKGQHLFNFNPLLHTIPCRTLVLAGECDPEHPLAGVTEMAKRIPKAELHVVHKSADPVYLDNPEDSKLLVDNFLSSFLEAAPRAKL